MTKLITGALIGISATSPLLTETVRDNLTTQIVESEVNSANETLTKINKVITSSLYFINQKTENHFVYESYKSVNITLEKDLKDIKEKNGVEIKQEHLRRGDLVFYNDNDGLNVGLFNGTDSVIIVKPDRKPGAPAPTNPDSRPTFETNKASEKVATAMPLTINYKTASSKQEESGVLPKTGQEDQTSLALSLFGITSLALAGMVIHKKREESE